MREVSREQAITWLLASKQGQLSVAKIQALIRDYQAGKWDPELHNNKKRVHVAEGRVVNGHHRLLLCAMFGPLMMYVNEA